jgi:hypothetical protein
MSKDSKGSDLMYSDVVDFIRSRRDWLNVRAVPGIHGGKDIALIIDGTYFPPFDADYLAAQWAHHVMPLLDDSMMVGEYPGGNALAHRLVAIVATMPGCGMRHLETYVVAHGGSRRYVRQSLAALVSEGAVVRIDNGIGRVAAYYLPGEEP